MDAASSAGYFIGNNAPLQPITANLARKSATSTTAAMATATTPATTSTSTLLHTERESIHSGQFMVSHFEAEEAQDDLDDDGEVKMLDPEDPSLAKPDDEPSTCLEVQLYVPQKTTNSLDEPNQIIITSHLEIETSLTKLFKCMNLAYSQKLTSPKWNHFKGVRLRWKDKIRLNNVIWRCWHMQFVQKRKTPVCQFASPLDVDTHNNPQTIVLEGKYWKRQLAVIKAEYRKWRKNYITNQVGSLTYDTRSEFDLVEWSPINERTLMLPEDWASDTLFTSINSPFPFPDAREIARAGLADFIQPSLGPLQPNLDEIDISFEDFMQNSRLETVPEESTDDMLKGDALYNFSAIMGAEQMDASNIMDITTATESTVTAAAAAASTTSTVNVGNSRVNAINVDESMLELNTSTTFADIEQEFVDIDVGNVGMLSANNNQRMVLINSAASLTNSNINNSSASASGNSNRNSNNSAGSSVNGNQMPTTLIGNIFTLGNDVNINSTASPSMLLSTTSSGIHNRLQGKHYADNSTISSLLSRQNEFPGKSVINGRISKTTQRPFRREPHNYDKAQPTLHQTNIYQQILADQQKNQQQQQQQQSLQTNLATNNLLQQPQQQLIYNRQTTKTTPAAQQFTQAAAASAAATINNFVATVGYINEANVATNFANNMLNMNPATQQQLMNVKVEPSRAQEMLTIFNTTPMTTNDAFGNATLASANAFKPYPNMAQLKKCVTTAGNFLNVGIAAAQKQQQTFLQEKNVPQQQQQQQQTQTQLFGTQSLPISLGSSQQELLQLEQQLNLTGTLASNIQQQQQQQQQQQLQTVISSGMQKEIHRSNSLPLNATLNKLEQFAMPKYHGKSASVGKARVRSNSIHQHITTSNNNVTNTGLQQPLTQLQQQQLQHNQYQGGSLGNLLLAQQMQATSEPMLTSTLAQLLTSSRLNSTINLANNQNSAATSAINSKVNSNNNLATQSATGAIPKSLATAKENSELLRQIQQHQQQQQQQLSPKKSASLPVPLVNASNLMLNHHPPQAKMLSYPLTAGQLQVAAAASGSSSNSSNSSSNLKISPELFQEQNAPHSPTQQQQQQQQGLKFPRETQQRRAGHIHAEQKRRCNIKYGFDTLHAIIPQLQQNPNSKLSKAAMLQKAAEYIKQLRAESNKNKEKTEALRMECEALNNSLSHLYSILPANGAPVTRQGTEHIRQLYDQYVRYGTMNNYKFWILGLILQPMFASYTNAVSSASLEELRRTSFLWVDQHCSLIDLRPAVSNKLKYLSMSTNILSDPPSTLQEEVVTALNNTTGQHPNLHGS